MGNTPAAKNIYIFREIIAQYNLERKRKKEKITMGERSRGQAGLFTLP